MTRDELERCAKFLDQGLTLDRDQQRALVAHALGQPATPHGQGCAWFRGEVCDCRDQTALDLRVKETLTGAPGPGHWWRCHGCGEQRGPFATEADRDLGLQIHAQEAHPR